MMSKPAPQTGVFLALLIYSVGNALGIRELNLRCKEAERIALLKIKESLYVRTPNYDVLSSWGRENEKRECCEWIGIRCHNKSGHVTSLDLSPSSLNTDSLGGNISSSLTDLHYLNYLDLSNIELDMNYIPSFIGNLSKLRYLNLSSIYLSGEVPSELGNLSTLQVLDLSHNFHLKIGRLKWASRLYLLRVLDLTFTDMKNSNDWLQVVTSLPSLTDLVLSNSILPDVIAPSTLSIANYSKSLAFLDLSGNSKLFNSTFTWLFNYSRSLVHLDLSECWFELALLPEDFGKMASLSYLSLYTNLIRGSIPDSFGNMTSLTYLNLCQNRLGGFIPESLGKLASLEHLDLHSNMLEGEIPKSIWEICALRYFNAYDNKLGGVLKLSAASSSRCDNFLLEIIEITQNRITGQLANFTMYSSLKELHLSSNQLTGGISESIGQLTKLEILDISQNSIQAAMSQAHFSKLQSLNHLDLSSNSDIALDIPPDWNPPFNLEHINLGSCKIGPNFPRWLRTQNNYSELNISGAGIADTIPSWFWNLPADLVNLDMSNNEITGTIPDRNHGFSYMNVEIDLSSNQFEGPVPLFLLQVDALNLYQNNFSDLRSICDVSPTKSLGFLDVSYNQLSGELPDCWSQTKYLNILILGNNKFTGKIPHSIGLLTSIEVLHLANNNFTGKLPLSLENCTDLMVFDVGGNKLTGEIPVWIGKSVVKLVILSLRSNGLYGSLPSKICHLGDLQVLDLSSNNLSATIPTCFGNFTAMRQVESVVSNTKHLKDFRAYPGFLSSYNDKLTAHWKGSLKEFQNLGLLKHLSLSSNKLTGEIPIQVTELIGLVSLDLSRNRLSGQIPREIGRMRSLDSLDLSKNRLSGSIPLSLSLIDRLNTLNLSANNLSGKIPTGPQLQNREASAYMDNPELCGTPLPKECPGDEEEKEWPSISQDSNDQDRDEIITAEFYISVGIGFFIGFCGIFWALVLSNSWKAGYFRLFNGLRNPV